jgi:hypothetical protein
MLAAHEAGDANAPTPPENERQQQQRHAITVIGNDHERPQAFASPDHLVPRTKEIESLVRRVKVVLKFQISPDCLSQVKVGEYVDCGDAA